MTYNDHSLFAQTKLFRLQYFDTVEICENGLGKGVFLCVFHVTSDLSNMFLDGVVARGDGVAALHYLLVFGLDFFK